MLLTTRVLAGIDIDIDIDRYEYPGSMIQFGNSGSVQKQSGAHDMPHAAATSKLPAVRRRARARQSESLQVATQQAASGMPQLPCCRHAAAVLAHGTHDTALVVLAAEAAQVGGEGAVPAFGRRNW